MGMTETSTPADTRRLVKIKQVLSFLEKISLKPKYEEVVDSIRDQFLLKGDISEKQEQYLFDIYERS